MSEEIIIAPLFRCPKSLEKYRIELAGFPPGDMFNGCLDIKDLGLTVIFSDGAGWEHVSVSRSSRPPSYDDMSWVKQQFWDNSLCVMELYVPLDNHVNCHPNCLHLWRPIGQEIPQPPANLVGPQ